MKFTKIRIIGLTTTDFPIIGAHVSDSYVIKEIDGLGPPVIDVSISNTLYQGGIYQGRRAQNRELVFKIGFNPDYSSGEDVSDLRNNLYGLLTPNRDNYIDVQIMNGNDIVAVTRGFVKNLDPVIFSKEPAVQIVVSCIDAYLTAPTVENINVSSLSKSSPVVENIGTATTGFHMELSFESLVSSWTITDNTNGRKMKLDTSFSTGDRLRINTIPGSRSIDKIYGGVVTNLVGSLTIDSDWLDLFLGANLFKTSSQNFNWNLFEFQPQYWGV